MQDDQNAIKLLEEINKSLKEINSRQEVNEEFSEPNKILNKIEKRVEYSLNQIQNSFDRIHDKIFNFNNILIATYLVLGTFPNNSPVLQLWTVIFPIINLIFLIILDVKQMEIHRFASNEMKWTEIEIKKYGGKIKRQTMYSLAAWLFTLGCLIYLIVTIFMN